MEKFNLRTSTKIAAYTTLIGSICMIAGAILMTITGADLDKALEMNKISDYLRLAGQGKFLLVCNLCIWIVGVILLGAAATSISRISANRSEISALIRYCYSIAIPIVVIAYSAWLVVVVKLSSQNNQESILVAESLGWFASRADWIATILVLAIGPVLISTAGRNDWVPNWLRKWSYFALFTGLLNALAMFIGGLTTYGFLIIPVGMGWMFATSAVLFKRLKMINTSEN